jgi:hypothetical protein
MRAFALAPMNGLVRAVTGVMFLIPVAFLAGTIAGVRLLGPGLAILALYGWVWVRMRPRRFIVHEDRLEVEWPMKRRSIPRSSIASVARIDRRALRDQVGWGARIGIGGLWGAFGWLWTTRRGLVQMYVSRTSDLVWIDRREGRSWLVSPESPDAFIAALSDLATPRQLKR